MKTYIFNNNNKIFEASSHKKMFTKKNLYFFRPATIRKCSPKSVQTP